jgi:hypothetical protein
VDPDKALSVNCVHTAETDSQNRLQDSMLKKLFSREKIGAILLHKNYAVINFLPEVYLFILNEYFANFLAKIFNNS